MYFETFHKLQQYEVLHPENFKDLTKEDFEAHISSRQESSLSVLLSEFLMKQKKIRTFE